MADDRKLGDDQYGGSEREHESRNRADVVDEVRSIADEEEGFEDREDLEDEEDVDGPY